MLSALYPEIDWPQIRCVGFDLDGTLYDEYEFIDQVYATILMDTEGMLNDKEAAGHWMRNRWLEKGSSYPHIFSEAFTCFGAQGVEEELFVTRALDTFRNYDPELELPARNRHLLETLRHEYRLFLVSDGNPGLQKRKFDALGLADYFTPEDCLFTGEHGADWQKPSGRSLEYLAPDYSSRQIVFFGDREVDREYAAAANIEYIHVYNLIGR
jgi:HAD superfamily hydrolase (TIGR01549 family)